MVDAGASGVSHTNKDQWVNASTCVACLLAFCFASPWICTEVDGIWCGPFGKLRWGVGMGKMAHRLIGIERGGEGGCAFVRLTALR